MAVRQYIGARYVPRFLGLYDNSTIYEALDVVDNGSGTSYIAKKTVPAGTSLTDTEFWFVYGASSGAIIQLQNRVGSIENEIDEREVYYTPEEYGAVADGVTDDITAINACIAAAIADRVQVKFSEKSYAVSTPILITNPIFIDGNNSKIIALTAMDSVMKIDIPHPLPSVGRGVIKSFLLDCNRVADRGLYVVSNINAMRFEDLQINNPILYGIHALNAICLNDAILRQEDQTNAQTSYALYIDAPDSKIYNVVCVNFNTGLYCSGMTQVDNFHPFLTFPGLMTTSVGVFIDATTLIINNSYIDTYAYVFKGNSGYALINGLFCFWSSEYYTDVSVGDSTTRPYITDGVILFPVGMRVYPPNGRSVKRTYWGTGSDICTINVGLNNLISACDNLPARAVQTMTSGYTILTSNITVSNSSIVNIPDTVGNHIYGRIEGVTAAAYSSDTPIINLSGTDLRPKYKKVFNAVIGGGTGYTAPVWYDENNPRLLLKPPAGGIPSGTPIIIEFDYNS